MKLSIMAGLLIAFGLNLFIVSFLIVFSTYLVFEVMKSRMNPRNQTLPLILINLLLVDEN